MNKRHKTKSSSSSSRLLSPTSKDRTGSKIVDLEIRHAMSLVDVLLKDVKNIQCQLNSQQAQLTAVSRYAVASHSTLQKNVHVVNDLAREQIRNQVEFTSRISDLFQLALPDHSKEVHTLNKLLEEHNQTQQANITSIQHLCDELTDFPSLESYLETNKFVSSVSSTDLNTSPDDLSESSDPETPRNQNDTPRELLKKDEEIDAIKLALSKKVKFVEESASSEELASPKPVAPAPDPLINTSAPGFHFENGQHRFPSQVCTPNCQDIIETNCDVPFYERFLYPKAHTNYIGMHPERGAIVISVENPNPEKGAKTKQKVGAVIRTYEETRALTIQAREKDLKKTLLQHANLPSNFPMKEVKNNKDKFQEELREMEQREIKIRQRYKFGVLYYEKSNQTENDMFGNRSGSADWTEFLDFLGTKIALTNWQDYAGGLDTSTGTTGENAVFLSHKNIKIIFHVSTMLPYRNGDPQQVERKRHLGNDVILIVFKEAETPFNPSLIRSHFNSVMFVVEKVPQEGSTETFYRLSVCAREAINAFPPFIPENKPIFRKDDLFHHFLVTKLINAERTALRSPAFKDRLQRARIGGLKAIVNDFSEQ